jgi:hypothetical protein
MAFEFGKDFEQDKLLAITDPVEWVKQWMKLNQINTTSLGEGDTGNADYPFDLGVFEVQAEGGGEGQGEKVIRIFAIAPKGSLINDIQQINGALGYVKLGGFYSSYNGTEWDDDLRVVYPKVVQVTKFNEWN